jgi:hypothetical protein
MRGPRCICVTGARAHLHPCVECVWVCGCVPTCAGGWDCTLQSPSKLFTADNGLIKVTTCKHGQPSVSALTCVGLHLCVVCLCVLWVGEGDIPE